jgi:PhnB protein
MSIIPNYVPSPMKTVNVVLTVKSAQKAVEFYNRAFGAEEVMRLTDPISGGIVHSEIRITDTIIMVNEEDPKLTQSPESLGGTGVTIQLYVPDAEGFWEEAVKAGAEVVFPIKKQFYGDRAGRLRDPFGHHWIIATHMEDLTAAEIHHRFHDLYN